MATTATITLASDIYSGFGGITKTMNFTKAGNKVDIDATTGFQRRKLTATGAVDLITMASLLIETEDSASEVSSTATETPAEPEPELAATASGGDTVEDDIDDLLKDL